MISNIDAETPSEVILLHTTVMFLNVAFTCKFIRGLPVRGVIMENKSPNWEQLSFNICRVCHCVQTLTQTLRLFRISVRQARLVPLIIHLQTKTGHMYGHTLACTYMHSPAPIHTHAPTHTNTRTHTHN